MQDKLLTRVQTARNECKHIDQFDYGEQKSNALHVLDTSRPLFEDLSIIQGVGRQMAMLHLLFKATFNPWLDHNAGGASFW